jgi:hypothetical protein
MAAGRRRREPAVSAEARKLFLEAVAAGWSVSEAARRAVTPRTRFYDLKKRDEQFAEEWVEADAQGLDFLRDEVRRRAVDGHQEEVYQQGSLAGYVTKKSDRLLELELKRRDPEYRERQQLAVSTTWRGEFELGVGVRVEHDYAAILEGLIEAGVIARGPAADAAIAEMKALQPKALPPGDDGPPSQPDGGSA